MIDKERVLNFVDLAIGNKLIGARNAVAIPDLGIAIGVVEPGVHIVYDLRYNVVARADAKGVWVFGDKVKAFWAYDIFTYFLFDNALVEVFTDDDRAGGLEVHYKDGREENASWIVGEEVSKPVFFGMVRGDRSTWHKDFFRS